MQSLAQGLRANYSEIPTCQDVGWLILAIVWNTLGDAVSIPGERQIHFDEIPILFAHSQPKRGCRRHIAQNGRCLAMNRCKKQTRKQKKKSCAHSNPPTKQNSRAYRGASNGQTCGFMAE
jgi:hypothetical protein